MPTTTLDEADRIMTICNACRYCEGFCAVFPAMERRRTFTERDLKYLATLCHNCRSCYYACQYAPPHSFGVNVPRTLGELRQHVYREYAWPKSLGGLMELNHLWVTLVTAAGVALVLMFVLLHQGSDTLWTAFKGPGAFYRMIPYPVLMWTISAVAIYALTSLAMEFGKAWRAMGRENREWLNVRAQARTVWDVLRLRYLDGGGHGCNYPDNRFRMIRRYFHHAVFYGFLSCFAATTIGFFYNHFLQWPAPYPVFSLPVMLGTLGGLAGLAGCGGLLYLKYKMDREPATARSFGMDVSFLTVLLLTNFTGIVLLLFRNTPLMGTLLVVHVGVVLGLFLTIPYGKFVHAVYRYASLLNNALEESRERDMA